MDYNDFRSRDKIMLYLMYIIPIVSGILFGMNIGVTNYTLENINKLYAVGIVGKEKYSEILVYGGVLGAIIAGLLAHYLGKKLCLVIAGILLMTLSICSSLTSTLDVFMACRFGLGVAVSIIYCITPAYLSEIAPTNIRGRVGVLFQSMFATGTFLITVINLFCAKVYNSPRFELTLMFLFIAACACFLLVIIFILPDSYNSPQLKRCIRQSDVRLGHSNITDHGLFQRILLGYKNYMSSCVSHDKLGLKVFLRLLFTALGLQMFQQLVGINMIYYYFKIIAGYLGIKSIDSSLMLLFISMISALPAMILVDKVGRKKLLYLGSIIMFVTITISGFMFMSISSIKDPSQVDWLLKIILFAIIVVYVSSFAFSWGAVTLVTCSELFTSKSRVLGMVIVGVFNWVFIGLVIKDSLFIMRYLGFFLGNPLSIMRYFGSSMIFFICAVFCIISILFVRLFVPETNDLTLEQIEANIKKYKFN